MTRSMLNEEKNIYSFIIDFLSWRKIEDKVIKHYNLGNKAASIYYQIEYGINPCAIYTEKYEFDFEAGVLNLSENEYLVTIYPEKKIKRQNNRIIKKDKAYIKAKRLAM